MAEQRLTERQEKWFASVQASLERDTGRTLDEWVAIARTCPHEKPRARSEWLREHHGLGVNRAAHVLSVAFPPETGWDDADTLRAALWTDPAALAVLEAVEAQVSALPNVVGGQRKGFTAFSRNFQFASLRPFKGAVRLGLALAPESDPRLSRPAKSEGWSERLTAVVLLKGLGAVDDDLARLLRLSWERS